MSVASMCDRCKKRKHTHDYPIILESRGLFDLVILFHEKGKGTVLYSESDQYQTGDYLTKLHAESFELFTGQITLEND